jgi:hypothetical protein
MKQVMEHDLTFFDSSGRQKLPTSHGTMFFSKIPILKEPDIRVTFQRLHLVPPIVMLSFDDRGPFIYPSCFGFGS